MEVRFPICMHLEQVFLSPWFRLFINTIDEPFNCIKSLLRDSSGILLIFGLLVDAHLSRTFLCIRLSLSRLSWIAPSSAWTSIITAELDSTFHSNHLSFLFSTPPKFCFFLIEHVSTFGYRVHADRRHCIAFYKLHFNYFISATIASPRCIDETA